MSARKYRVIDRITEDGERYAILESIFIREYLD